MTKKPYLIQYKEAIERGWIDIDGVKTRLVVGWKIKRAVDILCSYFDDPRIEYNPKELERKIEFQENYCFQGKAPYYNQPLKLMLWQKAFWEGVYAFYEKETGLRLISEAFLEVARKNGKTTMVAGDGDSDLFIGNGGVDICVCSNDDRQAKLIWSEIKGMKERLDPKDLVTSKTLTEIRNNQKDIKIIRLSSKTRNKDGFNFVKAYQDEAHDCKDGEIAEACERSMSTHDEHLFITISTNGFLGSESYFGRKLKYANAWLEGEIDNIHYFPFLFEQDDESEVWGSDRDMWQKANPSLIYGVKKWSYIEQGISKAQVDSESRIHLLTKDFNIEVGNSKMWLAPSVYDYQQEMFTLEQFRKCVCLGAVDLSDTGDLTIAEAMFMRKGDDTKYIVAQAFLPEAQLKNEKNGKMYLEWSQRINPQTGEPYLILIKGNNIDQKYVADWFQRLRDKYEIEPVMVGFDKWYSNMFSIWMDKKHYGINSMPILQNEKVMSFPMKMVERDLLAKNINFGNNPIMLYCFSNTSAKIKDDLIMPEKIEGQYHRKIDMVVTLIILYATLNRNQATFDAYTKEVKL